MRKEGKARKMSMNRPTALAPGNGTKAMTSASTNPRTRQPTVAPTAMTTVFHSASRNDACPRTSPYAATECPPPSGDTDCHTTSASG